MKIDEQKNDLVTKCRVWAGERNEKTKRITYNHAYMYALSGQEHPKDKIEDILFENSKPPYTWELQACKPVGDFQQCKGCKYEKMPRQPITSSDTYGLKLPFNFANAGEPKNQTQEDTKES